MPKLSLRLKIIFSILLGFLFLFVGLVWVVVSGDGGEDPLYGKTQDGVSVCLATTRWGDQQHFLSVSNENYYPVSVTVRLQLSKKGSEYESSNGTNKTEEEIHVELPSHNDWGNKGELIYPKKPTDSYSDILSIDVRKR